jgi:5'-3' exonuclease
MTTARRLYLIDASMYVFRAWFSMPDSMQDKQGRPVNAVYGYTHFLCQFIEQHTPDFIAAAFDESLATSFRNEIYPAYKANREPAPEELKRQFAQCKHMTESMGISTYSSDRYEADDLIGSLAAKMRNKGFAITIVSADKDMAQLLQRGDRLYDFAKGIEYPFAQISRKFGVKASQIVDLLALAGDAVDNIPGVPGIGNKTAVALLQHFDSLDRIYARLESVAQLPLRGAARIQGLLSEYREQAYLSRELSRIACNAPVEYGVRRLKRRQPDQAVLHTLFNRLQFGERLRSRIAQLV